MTRFYLVPIETVTQGDRLQRGPKYLAWRFDPDPPGIVCRWSMMPYGRETSALLLAHDISVADDATLVAHADVYAFPLTLDEPIAPQDGLRTFFETVNVPTDWLAASTTYRQFLRCLAGLFQFAQRYQGISGRPLFESVTLDSRYRNLTAQQQGWFTQTAQSFGYTLTINENRTLRQLCKQAGDAWGAQPFLMGGAEF